MALTAKDPNSNYRVARTIPFELRQHCAIYFEEKLYSQALNLLINILTSGTAAHAPAYVPAPQLLALATTILVHPSTTTRAKSKEEQEAASLALQLLRLTLHLVGPVSAKFDVAFEFTHFAQSRHGGRRRGEDSASNGSTHDVDEIPLNLTLSKAGSLWSRAEDFWQAVGWAFNCSVLYPKRWERWQIWLEFMCYAIEDDWEQRENAADAQQATAQPVTPSKRRDRALKESLLLKYLMAGSAGLGRNRRVLRAVFANGSATSLSEFREVFNNELKDLPKESKKVNTKKRAEVNIDEDEYGDYLSDDEDPSEGQEENSERSRPKRPRLGTRATKPTEDESSDKLVSDIYSNGGVATYGGFKSLALRKRLLILLVQASTAVPKAFMPLSDLYHLFVENIRHLPLPIFQAFVSPTALPWSSADAHSTLCEILLWRIRESSGPQSQESLLNQKKLEECFLPYAANNSTAVDNAKMSILLESLIFLLAQHDGLRNTAELREAVSTGNERRLDKAEAEIRRNKNSRKMETIERSWLIESADRLLYLVHDILPKED
ncbi:hypothetical protein BGW36DRAFT_424351 [Talaromyces proteolyticus]|uniref:Uncharacterized protein n=1 Tax=Talaromyces proteolyticus TaxID=1131652 RepID=A0AAD4KXE4_9EURO|nr:uncharacterized protein BGW36DRAFT_424351 [Talaromyces proteolyticus]KAH8702061.1 hypothetical protein BGW36DRAFT_424351 [Talaromyces proteolyticus]